MLQQPNPKRSDISDLQVCQVYRDRGPRVGHALADEMLMERTGLPYKVCRAAMVRAEARGLIDYGVSLRTGWLTEAGLELLKSAETDVK